MGRFKSAPVYTDDVHLDEKQMNQINCMLTALYNTARENGTQKVSKKEKGASDIVSEYSGRIVDPIARGDNNSLFLSFGLLLNGLVPNKKTSILRIKADNIKGYAYMGYSDETLSYPLPGTISVENGDIYFTLDDESTENYIQCQVEIYI